MPVNRLTEFKMTEEPYPCAACERLTARRQHRVTEAYACMECIRTGNFDDWLVNKYRISESEGDLPLKVSHVVMESHPETPTFARRRRVVTRLNFMMRSERGREGLWVRSALNWLIGEIEKGKVPL